MPQIRLHVENELKSFDVDELEPLQGELKKLSETNFNKLKKSLVEKGFKLVLHVWQNGGINYLIDGHQRVHVLQQLRKQGYDIPPIPCAIVQARTYSEAKETVLLAVSQYGKIDEIGFEDFISGEDFKLEDFDFPDFGADFLKLEEKQEKEKNDVPDEPVQAEQEFLVVVMAADEVEQKEIFEQLMEQGVTCKIM